MMNTFIGYERSKIVAALSLVFAISGSLVLTGCATPPEAPSREIQAAELAITNAEKARVADYASPALGEAREKLAGARRAVNDENMVLAKRLAEQARLDADLATARAAVARAGIVNDEMEKSTETIKQEMNRNPGVKP